MFPRHVLSSVLPVKKTEALEWIRRNAGFTAHGRD
jgi:hypothetical protein